MTAPNNEVRPRIVVVDDEPLQMTALCDTLSGYCELIEGYGSGTERR